MKAYSFNKSTNRYERSVLDVVTFAEIDPTQLGFLVYDIAGTDMYISYADANQYLPATEDPAGFLPATTHLTTTRPMTHFANYISESQTGVSVKTYIRASDVGFRLKGFHPNNYDHARLYMVNGFAYPVKKDSAGFYLEEAMEHLSNKKAHLTALEFPGAPYYKNSSLDVTMLSSGTLSDSSITITPDKWFDDLQPILVIGGILMDPTSLGLTFNSNSFTLDFTASDLLSKIQLLSTDMGLTGSETQEELLTALLLRANTFIFWIPVERMTWTKQYFSILGHRVHTHYKRFEGNPLVRSGLLRPIDYVITKTYDKECVSLLDDALLAYFCDEQGITNAGLDPNELEVVLAATHIQYNVTL